MNTWRNAVRQEKKGSSIRSSAGTSSRMSRNVVRPCISPESLANRLKSTGYEMNVITVFKHLFLFDDKKYDNIKKSRKRQGVAITVGGWPF